MMSEFLNLLPPPEALSLLLAHINPLGEMELVPSPRARGRVTAEPVQAPFPLPSFPRSTVDGYAVAARDTFGAGESLPAYLRLRGEVHMGTVPDFALGSAECALIHTGGMLPEGADAVVMVEYTQLAREGEVEVLRAVGVGENVLQVGEDVREGEVVIPAGVRLRPAEIGGLMALGIEQVRVARQPRIGIISSGDEVISPGRLLTPGQVYDVNTYTLAALVETVGGQAVSYGIIPDRRQALFEAARRAWSECDLVVLTAGSSVSTRDLTAEVIDRLGEPGVLVHGVNVRPGKPTILGLCDGKAVVGLAGNPVSALVNARLFVVPVIERVLGLARWPLRPWVWARLSLNLASVAGREDWVPVRIAEEVGGGYRAEPIFGKSNLIFTLVRADGLVRIPADANGLDAGEEVRVWLM